MAKDVEIYVEASYLKSLPNYENIRVTAGLKTVLEDGDDLEKTYEEAWDKVGREITNQLKHFSEEKKSIKKGL